MKLLALIITVILMSVFSESIYAQNQVVESKQIDVTGITDQELIDLRRIVEETNTINQNAGEKDSLLDEIHVVATELVPKQIAILLKRQKLQAFYEARDKYMLCLQNKNRAPAEQSVQACKSVRQGAVAVLSEPRAEKAAQHRTARLI